jgi:hypothetical protein
MARTPKRLFGPAQLTNSTATKYTCPALTKTIIRHIHVSNPSGSPVNLTVSIGADAAGTRIFDAYPIAATSAVDLYGYWVVDVAEIVAAFGSTTAVLVMVLNGDEITLG